MILNMNSVLDQLPNLKVTVLFYIVNVIIKDIMKLFVTKFLKLGLKLNPSMYLKV